jgi:pre-mRNA cleavage complex 2 protein Pcf11
LRVETSSRLYPAIIMSSNDKAAEVAEDYREALQDLTMNSRFEISNLTVVARENTEHALAIAETLQDHIKKVGPITLLDGYP